MATHQHQARGAQTHAEIPGSSTKSWKGASLKTFRKEQWERRIEKDWQGNLETLRQCISELLTGNQYPRMGLMKADKRSQQ